MTRLLLPLAAAFCCSPFASAAVLEVGPDGLYPTLQAALNVAVSNGQDDNIKIQAGTLMGQAAIASAIHAEDHFLEISGGWDASFDNGVSDPGATVLSGGQQNQVLQLTVSAGDVRIRNLTIRDGSATNGGGADLAVSGQNTSFQLFDCEVLGNAAFGGTPSSSGGGVRLTVTANATTEINDCLFAQNTVQASTASGGGLMVVATDGSFRSSGLEFINNLANGSGLARGGALAVDAGDQDPVIEFFRLDVRNNSVQSNSSTAGAGLFFLAGPSLSGPFATIEGARFIRNQRLGSAPGAAQLEAVASNGNLTLRSVAAVDGINASGVRIDATNTAQVFGVNTTAAGNDVDGIRHEDGSNQTQVQYNAIAFGNGGADLVVGDDGVGSVLAFGNLTTTDPGVIDAANGNYRLMTGSPAIDSCINSPVGGIGTLDADFGARAVNGVVDCGAYEWSPDNEDAIFNDGFETI